MLDLPIPTPTPTEVRLRDVLVELEIEHDELTPATRLRADLDIDSAELVEIVAGVLGGRLEDGKALKGIATIGELVTFLEARA